MVISWPYKVPVIFRSDAHYVKSVRIRSFSGPYFPALRRNTERYSISLCIQSECRKERTKKTPNKDTFHVVAFCYGIQNFQNHRFKTKSKNYKEKQKEKAHHIWIKYGLLVYSLHVLFCCCNIIISIIHLPLFSALLSNFRDDAYLKPVNVYDGTLCKNIFCCELFL